MPKSALHAAVFAALVAGCSALDPLFARPGAEDFRPGKLADRAGQAGRGPGGAGARLPPRPEQSRVPGAARAAARRVHQQPAREGGRGARRRLSRSRGGHLPARAPVRRAERQGARRHRGGQGRAAPRGARCRGGEARSRPASWRRRSAHAPGYSAENGAHARARELRSSIEQRLVQARDARQGARRRVPEAGEARIPRRQPALDIRGAVARLRASTSCSTRTCAPTCGRRSSCATPRWRTRSACCSSPTSSRRRS